jgi:DNA-binding IscR family transcriptional regulator
VHGTFAYLVGTFAYLVEQSGRLAPAHDRAEREHTARHHLENIYHQLGRDPLDCSVRRLHLREP